MNATCFRFVQQTLWLTLIILMGATISGVESDNSALQEGLRLLEVNRTATLISKSKNESELKPKELTLHVNNFCCHI